MSTNYRPYCIDCDEEHIVDNNNQDKRCAELIRDADKLAVLHDMILSCESIAECVLRTNGYDRIDLSWFAKHARHKLAIKDEYGRVHSGMIATRVSFKEAQIDATTGECIRQH